MTDNKKPLILVSGATGAQGGSVVKHLLAGGFRVRGLTRDTKSSKAQALQALGAEVVVGDLKDRKSLDAALVGADGFFLVTQFWEKHSEDDEVEQGVTAIEAAKAANVKHVVFSTLSSPSIAAGMRVVHFDGKWKAALALIGSSLSYTLVFMPFYMENWSTWFKPHTGADGKQTMGAPMGGKPFVQGSVADLGAVVALAFKFPQLYNEKVLEFAADNLTVTESVAIYNKVHGTEVVPVEMPVEAYAKLPYPGAAEMAEMFKWYQWVADHRASGNPYSALGVKPRDYVLVDSSVSDKFTSLEAFFRAQRSQQ